MSDKLIDEIYQELVRSDLVKPEKRLYFQRIRTPIKKSITIPIEVLTDPAVLEDFKLSLAIIVTLALNTSPTAREAIIGNEVKSLAGGWFIKPFTHLVDELGTTTRKLEGRLRKLQDAGILKYKSQVRGLRHNYTMFKLNNWQKYINYKNSK